MLKTKERKILMVYQDRSTFVVRDINILSETWKVDEFKFNYNPRFKYITSFIRQFFLHLFLGFKYDRIVIQGAGYYSFIPTLINKIWPSKSIIIAIGTDCAKLPEINYGNFRKSFLGSLTGMSFRFADLILPVHNSLGKMNYSYDEVEFPDQGIKNLVKNIKTPITEVVNGYKHAFWSDNVSWDQRPSDFLTAAAKLSQTTYFRKGYDLILDLAERLPNKSFTLIGTFPKLRTIPPNVTLISNMDQKGLLHIYNQHKYYFQLSMFEGFPNALCEAMLCGCIPIGSNVAGIPDIIGDEGYLLKRRNIDILQKLVVEVLAKSRQIKPRERIINNFPIERREKELNSLIKEFSN